MHVVIAGPTKCYEFSCYVRGTPALPAGMGGTAVTALVHGLLRGGHEVSVVTLDPSVRSEQYFVGSGFTLSIGQYRTRARSRAKDLFRVERQAVTRMVESQHADVVNAHWTYEYALGSLAANASTLVTVRDWAPRILAHRRDPYRLIRWYLNSKCIASSRNLSCVSPYIMELLADRGREASLTPNMVTETVRLRTARTNRNGRTVISVGNGFGGWRNTESLLRAMRFTRNCKLTLVGADMGPGGAAEQWARREGLTEGVEFRGALDHATALELIANADVLVHPSLEESFGNVLVEAMAQGVPVIGGINSGAVPWVLDGGRAGTLVDVRDPMQIGAAISHVLNDDAAWMRLSAAGAARVRDCFSESSVVASYIDAYQRVLKR